MAQLPRDRTIVAFANLRSYIGAPRQPRPEFIRNPDECKPMTGGDGLEELVDGPVPLGTPSGTGVRLITDHESSRRNLWVVTEYNVVYASEDCAFGRSLDTGVIKHTNLTGGAAAYAGGELLQLDGVLVVNGKSGRYTPQSPEEMRQIAVAFANSGYHVWSMGYDTDANFPNPFIGVLPELVS